jgi:hypothetical protein
MEAVAMRIEMGKKYRTRDGREVRIYAVTHGGDQEVVGAVLNSPGGWVIEEWSALGDYFHPPRAESDLDLVEVGQYDHIKIDDKVLVWDDSFPAKSRQYFAGVDGKGNPTTFNHGTTSWSRDNPNVVAWTHCELAEDDK